MAINEELDKLFGRTGKKTELIPKPSLGKPTGMDTSLGITGSASGSTRQKMQGDQGNVGSSVGSAVQSGTGATATASALGQTQQQMLDEQNLGFAPTVNEATREAIANASNPSQTQGQMLAEQSMGIGSDLQFNRLPSVEGTTRIGDPLPTKGNGAFSVVGTGQTSDERVADINKGISALQDLRQYKLGMGQLKEDRPVTTIGGYKSYAEDLAAFQSGDVRSAGYQRIRNERMQLKSQIDDATRGISGNKAKAAIIESMLSDYSATQKEKLGQEADTAQAGMAAQADMVKAQYDAASSAADRQQRAAETAAQLGISQADLLRKQEADQAEQQARRERLGFDVAKSMQESELAQSKLGLEERDLFRKSYEAGQSAQARDAGLKIKQFNAELELYKDATGEVPEEIRMQLAKKYGFTE